MNEFKDRRTEYPNRKKLTVKNIEYDSNGDISELLVDTERQEGEVYEEGTELKSKNLNQIISKMIKENIIICMSPEQATYLDKRDLKLDDEYGQDFELISVGEYGSQYTWQVKNGVGINIEGNIARVTRQEQPQIVTLEATIEKEGVVKTREFVITILENACQEVNRTISLFSDGSSSEFASFYEEIDEDVNVIIENDYSTIFDVSYQVNLTQMYVCITTSSCSNSIDDGVMEYSYVVKLKSKSSGVILKKINCNVILLDSITPDD